MRVLTLPLLALIRAYQIAVSPLLPAGTCKFHPSCSHYAAESLRRYGVARGAVLAVWRLLRCHPWSGGGVDHPAWPPRRTGDRIEVQP